MDRNIDEEYMRHCLRLAEMGLGSVAPNPMVGSIIVHDGIIVGEGFHRKYGEAHAEVNAIKSVKDKQRFFCHEYRVHAPSGRH